MISVALTSCGRVDLLKRTIDSFNKWNTYPIRDFIIVDDSGDVCVHKEIKSEYPDYTLIFNNKNIGQIASIDKAYSHVNTKYVFHCEDDWEFCCGGFIEKSLAIMESNQNIMTVWIKERADHPIEPFIYNAGDVQYQLVSENFYGWHGFGFNPGLKSIEHYKTIGRYSDIGSDEKTGIKEQEIGEFYHKRGYRAAIIWPHCVYHIGQNRHVSYGK